MSKRFQHFRVTRMEKNIQAYIDYYEDLEKDNKRRYERLKNLSGLSANKADAEMAAIVENNIEIKKIKDKVCKLTSRIGFM